MERLTDKKVAENLKSNIEGLKKAGVDISVDDLRYIKLAEYENEEERQPISTIDFDESRNMDDVQYMYYKFIEPLEKRVAELEKMLINKN